jgi:hypothetical protein
LVILTAGDHALVSDGEDRTTLEEQRRALLRAYYAKRRRAAETRLAWRRIFALQNTPARRS